MSLITKPLQRLLLASAVAGAMAVAAAAPAGAVTVGSDGTPGTATVPFAQGSDLPSVLPRLIFPARTVYRSPAYSGTQVISVTYVVMNWNPAYHRWQYYGSASATNSNVAAGYAYRAPSWSPQVSPWVVWGEAVIVTWKTPSGTVLGDRSHNYTSTSDYQCLTSRCSILSEAGHAGIYFDINGA